MIVNAIAMQSAGIFNNPTFAFIMFGGFLISFLIFVVFLFIARGPAMQFMKAKIAGGAILISVGKDRMASVEASKYKAGAFESKSGGWFGVGLNSIYPTRKARIPIGIAFDPIGITLDPRYVKAIEQLKKANLPYEVIIEKVLMDTSTNRPRRNEGGSPMTVQTKESRTQMQTLSDLQNFIKFCEYHKSSIYFDDMSINDKVEHKKECRYCSIFEEGIDMPRETVAIQEIGGFVEKNINPAFIQANIDTAVRIALNEQKSIPVKWIILLPTIIIFSAIAAAILFQVIGTGDVGSVAPVAQAPIIPGSGLIPGVDEVIPPGGG
jgi:hypothetical protein